MRGSSLLSARNDTEEAKKQKPREDRTEAGPHSPRLRRAEAARADSAPRHPVPQIPLATANRRKCMRLDAGGSGATVDSGVENAIPSVGTQKKVKIGAIVSTYRVDNQYLVQTGPTHPWQRESSKHSGVENAIPSVGTQKRDKIGA